MSKQVRTALSQQKINLRKRSAAVRKAVSKVKRQTAFSDSFDVYKATSAVEALGRLRKSDPEFADAIDREVEAQANVRSIAKRLGKSRSVHSASIGSAAYGHAVSLMAARRTPGVGDIVREGTVGGRIMDGSIVVGSALLTARLDEMIDARPLGLKPSTIKAIIEGIILALALWKRSRAVTRYAALSLIGTAGGKLSTMSVGRGDTPSP